MVWLARRSWVASPRQQAAEAPTDAVLVAAAQADPRAFLALYERYVDRIYGYCYARLGSKETAEDATSEVFTRALAAIGRYQDGTLLSREEMLRIVAGLALVWPDGAALPQPASSETPGAACFAETGRCAAGSFLDYWEAHDGLALNGYPLTGEMLEQLEDGCSYQVQYFERVRLEFHPENAGTPYEVLLGQFGRRILNDGTQNSVATP